MRHKIAGICVMCTEPATDDTVFCEAHRERKRLENERYRNRGIIHP
jgi:predicted nucleic acid-binding Zn ribbon protein